MSVAAGSGASAAIALKGASSAAAQAPQTTASVAFFAPLSEGVIVSCIKCRAQLLKGKVIEKGHSWNGKQSWLFSSNSDEGIAQGELKTVTAVQGSIGYVDSSCEACGESIGWKFISSPIPRQVGANGFMLPCVDVQAESSRQIVIFLEDPKRLYDKLDHMVHEFMQSHGILGMSAAYAVGNETLVRSWGYASCGDSIIDQKPSPLTQGHSMRIASVSKPITSVAILRLCESGSLELDATLMSVLPTSRFGNVTPKDPRVKKITVRHLLHHVCGGWNNHQNDVMFQFPGKSRDDLICHVLSTVMLDDEPGTKYAYSNFGYCLLGRIIEGCDEAGKSRSYEKFVQEEIFARCAITGELPCIETADSETCNFGQPVLSAVDEVAGWLLNHDIVSAKMVNRMDSHGGWVAKASDLVAFSKALASGALLSKESLINMGKVMSGLKNKSNYGMGVCTNQNAWWHTGSLSGTGSIWVHGARHGKHFGGNPMHWCWIVNTGNGCEAADAFAWKCLEPIEAILSKPSASES